METVRGKRLAAVLAATACLLAAEAYAGIYKCTGPDGKTVFTSDRSACPGAKPHVLKKKLQTVLDGHDSRVLQKRSRPAARRVGAKDDGIERMWRRKRPEAERELEQVEAQLTRMLQVIKGCNRGGEWYRTEESGIRTHVPCSELQERYTEIQQKRGKLVRYLADGLEDECRRAGCQPGWVR